MASKRKLEEKKRRVTLRRQDHEELMVKRVAAKLLGDKSPDPPRDQFLLGYGTERDGGLWQPIAEWERGKNDRAARRIPWALTDERL